MNNKLPKEVRRDPVLRGLYEGKIRNMGDNDRLSLELELERAKVKTLRAELDLEVTKAATLRIEVDAEKIKMVDVGSRKKAIADLLGPQASQIAGALKNWDTITASQRWTVTKIILKALLINEVQEEA